MMGEHVSANEDLFVLDPETLRQAVENASANLADKAIEANVEFEPIPQPKLYGYVDSNLHGFDDWADCK